MAAQMTLDTMIKYIYQMYSHSQIYLITVSNASKVDHLFIIREDCAVILSFYVAQSDWQLLLARSC